ncbi:MAG: threonylcarbamoyl-AMP synthase [Gammaproteobacteria bacterium]|nr:threonylcarbamoyl-AMP synthase [Gammaproteobacteria bacterium]
MSQMFRIHPDNPQERLIRQSIEIIKQGGVIVYPTDTSYAIGCGIGHKDALDRIKQIRHLESKHNFTLLCRDLSEIATYAIIDTPSYRLIKSLTPGAYTFLLKATKEVPRRLQHPKRKTIGIRIPDNKITLALLEALNEPLISSSMILPGEKVPLNDPEDIKAHLEKQVDLIIDGGICGLDVTTVVELNGETPKIIRRGKGKI